MNQLNNLSPRNKQKNPGGARLRSMLNNNPTMNVVSSVLTFVALSMTTYLLSSAVGEEVWFSIIFGVTMGALGFCVMRLWLDEGEFDSPDTKAYIILSGTLSFIGIVLAYVTLRTFPFGEHTVLIIDMHHQYVAFYSLLREKLLSFSNLLYSDSLGLGASFLPMWAYYVASPFSLITLLFPKDMITEALMLITVLKITSAGVTFSIFAKNKFGRNDFSIVIGSVAYSMMSFIIGHSWNLMWLDPIILLPLIVLGLEKLLKEGKPMLYCITLAAALICNYYISYMICVFLVFYFLAYVISEKNTAERKPLSELGGRLYRITAIVLGSLCVAAVAVGAILGNTVVILGGTAALLVIVCYMVSVRAWRFCYGSLIAGGMSALVVVPTFLALMTTSGADDSFSRKLDNNFSFFELFPRSLFSAAPSMRGDALPNIYCTVLVLVLVVMFLTCGAIQLRKRLAWGGLVAVVALGMAINWTNFAWHGFHFPNDLPYRFSFLMSFAMICVAMQMLDKLDKLTPCGVTISAVIVAALILIEQQFGTEADFTMIFVSLIAVIGYSVLIGLQSAGIMKRTICFALLAVLVFCEAASNASVELVKLDSKEYYTERSNFIGDFEANRLAFDTIDEYKADSPSEMMYREELLPRKTCNDPSLFGYDGVSVFASSNRRSVTTLMGKLGYAVNGVNSYLYKNFVPVADSLIGVKYIALGHSISGHQQLVGLGSVTDSDNVESRYIYQNSKALSKAFVVSRGIINWEFDDQNPFVVQNDLLRCAVGAEDVYELIGLHHTNASSYDEGEGGYVNSESGTKVSEFNCDLTITGTYFTCSRVSESLEANFTVSQKMNRDGQAYVYVDCRAAESISVKAGDTNVGVNPTEPYIVDLGHVTSGSDVDVTIHTNMSCGGNVFLAMLNNDVFDSAVDTLKRGNMDVTSYKEGKIDGTVTSSIDGMMFTSIPYDGGWNVKVDGKRVPTFALGDGLLCFAVPTGTHTVSMRFFPDGLLLGAIITLFSVALFVLLVNKKTREWLTDAVFAPVYSTNGVDYRYPPATEETITVTDQLPTSVARQTPTGFSYSEEGFSTVSLDELDDEPVPPVFFTEKQKHSSSAPKNDMRIQENRSRADNGQNTRLPSGFEQFFEDDGKK